MNKNLLERARKKYLASIVARELSTLSDSPLAKQYRLSMGCQAHIVIHGDGLISSPFYCKNRWCQCCASIMMATQINNYHAEMSKLQDVYFVTLTQRTVPLIELDATIDAMAKRWRQITTLARVGKHGVKLIGLRKLEVKASARPNYYHPHYHILVEGEAAAQWLIEQWLKRSPTSTIKAQDARKVDNLDAALVEVMKYTTKLTAADDSSNQVLATPRQLDAIFRALYKRRVYQPFGGLKKLNEYEFNPTEEHVKRAAGLYTWLGVDWFHNDFGTPLSGWTPEGDEVQIYNAIKRRNKQLK